MFEFYDECRAATITAQTIPNIVAKVTVSKYLVVPPFEDSLDDTGAYDPGICGEKRIILHSDTPRFLTV